MVNVLHKNLTGADAVHPSAFVQPSDPGAVGANLQWIDTSIGPPYTLKLRNPSNTGWLVFAAGPTGATGPQGNTGPQGSSGLTTVTGAAPYVCIQDQKASATAGGTFTAGSFVTRVLNAYVVNDQNLATLDPILNRITLPPGTWRCMIQAPGFLVNGHVARLQNISASSTVLYGTSESAGTDGSITSYSKIVGRFGITSPTVLEIQHRCETTRATNGLGAIPTGGFAGVPSIFTTVEFWLEGLPPPVIVGTTALSANPSFENRNRQSRAALY